MWLLGGRAGTQLLMADDDAGVPRLDLVRAAGAVQWGPCGPRVLRAAAGGLACRLLCRGAACLQLLLTAASRLPLLPPPARRRTT